MDSSALITKAIRQLPDLKLVQEYLEQASEAVIAHALSAQISGLEDSVVFESKLELESMAPHTTETVHKHPTENLIQAGKRAVNKIHKEGTHAELMPEEVDGLEAIIALIGRPAILIQDGRFFLRPLGWEILEQVRPSSLSERSKYRWSVMVY
jgi:hypothetical protein